MVEQDEKERRRTYNKRYYEKNKDKVLKQNREWRANNRTKMNSITMLWRDNNRNKWNEMQRVYQNTYHSKNKDVVLAHQKIQIAKMKGDIIQQPCAICGSLKSEAHHDDYSKPLEVRWLCSQHHSDWHRLNKAKKEGVMS